MAWAEVTEYTLYSDDPLRDLVLLISDDSFRARKTIISYSMAWTRQHWCTVYGLSLLVPEF